MVDRLSDVAGPLRPRERFEPYLTSYPLPSGERHVLARTWQDLEVSRAGCVRTVSLIIPAADWASAASIAPFLDLLDVDLPPQDAEATRETVPASLPTPLPLMPGSGGGEVLEALFLEEAGPVVVFDAPAAELMAVRLLTALWPSLRKRFALSTFALSPRKVGGRDFDLTFAPKDARAKFSDWKGRRIDGRSNQVARHRWTGAIASRVFEQPCPQLLSPDEMGLVGGSGDEADDAAALRIVLLWDELRGKLQATPAAALGLLDIVNSGKVRDSSALRSLEPSLAEAVRRASATLPEDEAWGFLAAIARKTQGRSMPYAAAAVGAAVAQLAGRAPEAAVAFLAQPDPRGIVVDLLPKIAQGIGGAFAERAEQALLAAQPEVLGRLIAGDATLAGRAAGHASLIGRLGDVLPQLEPWLADVVGENMLPRLMADWQLPAALPLLARLDGKALAEEMLHLGLGNDFAAPLLCGAVIERARGIGARHAVRSSIAAAPPSERRDAMLARALDPTVEDVAWLLDEPNVPAEAASRLLTELLDRADDSELCAIMGDGRIGADLVRALDSAGNLLRRAALSPGTPIETFVRVVALALREADPEEKVMLAERALHRCLGLRFEGDEVAFLATMLGLVAGRLDGAWAAQAGLGRSVGAPTASRNMAAFRKAPQPARLRIVRSVADVARVLRDRRSFDLDAAAADACADLLLEAAETMQDALPSAAGYLLPMLMRQRRDPVSTIIAAAFPVAYRELAREEDVPDFLQFVPFFDWDRCKAARHELVAAFMSATWPPGDLALTACRCGDVGRILGRVAKSHAGAAYIERVAHDLGRLPRDCREPVERTINAIRSR